MMQNKEIPQGYKDSPLGIIPQEWEVKRLGEVFEQISSYSFSREQMTRNAQKLQYIHYGDIHLNVEKDSVDLSKEELPFLFDGLISDEKLRIGTFPFLKDGDIILADASEDYEGVGKSWEMLNVSEKKVIAGLHTIVLRKKENNVFVGFGRYIFRSPKGTKLLKRIAQGTKVYSISYKNICKLDIPLPPLPEQQKIAEILTCWDEAIEKQSQLIEKLETRKRGLMQQLLTGKKRLKGFEGEWRTVKLGEILSESSIVSPKTDVNKRITVRLNLKGVEVRDVKGTEAENSTVFFMRKSGQFIYGKQNLHKGAFGIIPKELNDYESTQDLPAFDFKDVVVASYFIYFISRKKIYESFESIAIGTGAKRIHPKDLFRRSFSFPPIEEQTAIVNILSSADKEIEKEKAKLATLRSQKKGLMQVLLTGKKRVKI